MSENRHHLKPGGPSRDFCVDPDRLVFRLIVVLYALFVLFVPGGGHAL